MLGARWRGWVATFGGAGLLVTVFAVAMYPCFRVPPLQRQYLSTQDHGIRVMTTKGFGPFYPLYGPTGELVSDPLFALARDVLVYTPGVGASQAAFVGVARSGAPVRFLWMPERSGAAIHVNALDTDGRYLCVTLDYSRLDRKTETAVMLGSLTSSGDMRVLPDTIGARLDPAGTGRMVRWLSDRRLVLSHVDEPRGTEEVVGETRHRFWVYDFTTECLYLAGDARNVDGVKLRVPWRYDPWQLQIVPHLKEVWLLSVKLPGYTSILVYNIEGDLLGVDDRVPSPPWSIAPAYEAGLDALLRGAGTTEKEISSWTDEFPRN